ncbi:MAG: CHAT domain-containing protein [Vicinamibacterales bacterium]|nr:CHAT domain-containing protein [Vicinamibacterales bacterium]
MALLAAAVEAEDMATRRPSPRASRIWGSALLLLGRADDALQVLRDAAFDWPEDPSLLSDLSAALLARGAETGDSSTLVHALEAVEAALAISPRHVEAHFNRAVILESLHLRVHAHDAWQAYLALESSVGWASEAIARQSRLLSQADHAADSPDRVRVAAEHGWLSATSKDSVEASFDALAIRHHQATRDPMLREAAERLRGLQRSDREELQQAHRDYAAGAVARDRDRLMEAIALFKRARAAFRLHDSPYALWCEYQLAAIDYQSRRYGDARTRLSSTGTQASRAGYAVLLGHVRWTEAVLEVSEGDFTGGLRRLGDALVLAEQTAERVLTGRLLNQMAEVHHYLGREREAFAARIRALDLAAETGDHRLQHSVYGALASVLVRQNLLGAASVVLDAQAAVNASGIAPASVLTMASRQVAVALAQGRLDDGLRYLHRAGEALEQLRTDPRYDTLRAAHVTMRARVAAAQADTVASEAWATEALVLLGTTHGRELQQADALLIRAYVRALASAESGAEDDIAQALALLDRRRRDDVQTLFGSPDLTGARTWVDMILATAQDSLSAQARLRFVDAVRTMYSPLRGVSDWEAVTARLGAEATLVYYAVLPDETVAWTVTARQITETRLPATRADLQRIVERLRRDVARSDASAVEAQLRVLNDLLIAQLPIDWSTTRRLIVCPDWPIDGVPFPALTDRVTGERILVRAEVSVVEHLALSPVRAASGRSRHVALVLANPVSADASRLGLPALRGAEEEARQVGELYPIAKVLLGREATSAALRASVGAADVVHMAVHSLVDSDDGSRSRVLLAGVDEGASLRGEELLTLELSGVDVVVLAACSTAVSDARPHSPLALTTQFLAAGPGAVIGALWDVPDAGTEPFMVALHRHLARGQSAAAALRETQMEFARERDADVSVWAAFVVHEPLG